VSEDRNIHIDYRFASGNSDRYLPLAQELLALQPDLIVAVTTPIAATLLRETRSIPIVFTSVSDPIGAGFVASLARPGGNFTGVLLYEAGITGKWLAMLKEIAPRLTRAALIGNPKTTPFNYFQRAAEAVAPSLAIELVPTSVENTDADIKRAIESFAASPNGGLVVLPDTTTVARRDLIVALAARNRLPRSLPIPPVCRCRRSDRLWHLCGRRVSAGGDLCGPHPARRETRRPASRGADQVRNSAQPQSRKGARP
jgi:putative tryptophan/tyrosine transport system substrate-binding protein